MHHTFKVRVPESGLKAHVPIVFSLATMASTAGPLQDGASPIVNHIAESPYDSAATCADIILRSSDLIDFYVLKAFLSHQENMFFLLVYFQHFCSLHSRFCTLCTLNCLILVYEPSTQKQLKSKKSTQGRKCNSKSIQGKTKVKLKVKPGSRSCGVPSGIGLDA